MATQVIASDGRPDGIMSFHHFSHGRSLRGGKMSIYPEVNSTGFLRITNMLAKIVIFVANLSLHTALANYPTNNMYIYIGEEAKWEIF